MELQKQSILVTGCNRGIGKAFAIMCAKESAHLILANRKSNPALVEELKAKGAASVQEFEVDLADRRSRKHFLERTKDLKVDILFNNAGLLTGGLLEDQKWDEIESMLEVNVNSLIHLTHSFLPRMIQQKSGKIINHASVSSVMHFPCATTYSAAKAAVLGFTRCLQPELKGTGVSTLVLVTPGIDTDMFRDIPKKYGTHLNLTAVKGMNATKYAEIIREAILEDLTELHPQGFTGFGLKLAQHTPSLFEKIVSRGFKR
jgi:short-subunit dehydrogenase